ncbi:MAG: YetF domain-containing protein [Bacillota bacterium]
MLVLTLVVVEFSQLKSDKIEKFITGISKILIKNGKLQESRLRKLRFTVDQLELKLRQASISKIMMLSLLYWRLMVSLEMCRKQASCKGCYCNSIK